MKTAVCPLLVALLLAGCDKEVAPTTQASKAPADPTIATDGNPNCHVDPLSRNRSRAGDDIPMRMYVVNRNAWCFSGFAYNSGGKPPAEVYTKPSNGDLRMIVREGGATFGYRPAPGFVGDDSFTILMPTGVLGIDSHVKVKVAVTAP